MGKRTAKVPPTDCVGAASGPASSAIACTQRGEVAASSNAESFGANNRATGRVQVRRSRWSSSSSSHNRSRQRRAVSSEKAASTRTKPEPRNAATSDLLSTFTSTNYERGWRAPVRYETPRSGGSVKPLSPKCWRAPPTSPGFPEGSTPRRTRYVGALAHAGTAPMSVSPPCGPNEHTSTNPDIGSIPFRGGSAEVQSKPYSSESLRRGSPPSSVGPGTSAFSPERRAAGMMFVRLQGVAASMRQGSPRLV
jgi:hypothetical protein